MNITSFTAVLAAFMLLSGCAGSQGPAVVVVPHDRYSEAFDAAVEVARENGLRPSFMDRRSGVIETEPAMAASLMEPWKGGNADFNQALRNTLSRNRLRARFEFSRAGFAARSDSDEIPPMDLLAMNEADWDLTRDDGPLDLKVWVFEERGHSVGQRRNQWTFAASSHTYHQPVEGQWSESPVSFWTPTTRDRAAEKRLLAEVETRLKPTEDSKTLN
ncbi:MAG: hypothetical protein MK089_12730 [Phycisphaerales bacterium]|nr:hypothetical protein [Phycisphaerales bacterium]